VWSSVFAPTAVHAIAGMETALFACLLTAHFAALTRAVADPAVRRMRVAAALGFLASATRPEGNLAVLAGAIAAAAMLPRGHRGSWLRALLFVYLLPTGLYVVWRAAYYGQPFPLPFYVKVAAQAGLAGQSEVVAFLRSMAVTVGPLALLGGVRAPRPLRPALVAAGIFLVFYLVPRHIMSFDWRYLYPNVPLVFVLAATGLGVLQERLSGLSPTVRAWRLAHAGVLALCVVGAGWPIVRFDRDAVRSLGIKDEFAQIIASYATIGRELRAAGLPPERQRLAIADAGAIPYYSGWYTIDLFGLNDAAIARRGVLDPGYVLAEKPDLIVVNSKSLLDFIPRLPGMEPLYKEAVLAGFEVVQKCAARWDYYPWILGKRGNPVVERFVRIRAPAVDAALVEIPCQRCGTILRLQADPGSPLPLQPGYQRFPANAQMTCSKCGTLLVFDSLRPEMRTQRP
jgi:hypothetical protein